MLKWRSAPADEAAALLELTEFLLGRLPRQYVPRYFEVIDELPKTNTGKAQKNLLRARSPQPRRWDREGRPGMKVLVVYSPSGRDQFPCDPASRRRRTPLQAAGHEVDDFDLYAEGFNPVMSREERLGYHDVPSNRAPVEPYLKRLQRAEGLVFCFPTWCFGLPAMLKEDSSTVC